MNPSPCRALILLALIPTLAAAWPGQGGAVRPLKDFLGDPAYPDDLWRASAPAAEGLDGARLEAAAVAVVERKLALHAFLVVRHGKLVFERYGTRDGRQLTPADDHPLHSTTKTFTGTLVGLAIADGTIGSVRTPVLPFFAGDAIGNRSEAKETMVVEDLLTMRSGLDYREGADEGLFQAEACSALAFLGRPVVSPPGLRWNYSSGDSQILAEVLRRATGRTPLAFAQARLFEPLGITQVRWQADEGGTQHGGRGLSLRPRDLARFGQLLLQRGSWNGVQLVPAAWLDAAMKPHADTPWEGGRYAYQGWVPRLGGFATRGYEGQDMYVFPDLDLVVVFNAALPYQRADATLDGLVQEFVLPAVRG
jgi:CubicO group peptidase (beta-lactamase class C family)